MGYRGHIKEKMRQQQRREQMCIVTRCKKKKRCGQKGGSKGRVDREKSKEEKIGKPSFGRRSDDTAHPSQWQVPAVAPLQRTQANTERQSSAPALHFDNTTGVTLQEQRLLADCLI